MVQKPLYDLTKSFEYNLEQGPFFEGVLPGRIFPSRAQWHQVFDYDVMSLVGLAACPLGAHVKGIELASRLGFDIITHKTIRSHAVAAHPWPNVAYVEPFKNMASLSITNSIGNASCELDWHCEQIVQSRSVLLPGQLLIVSIFGTAVSGRTVAQDFAYIAHRAIEAGAQVIELNFSCPNAQHGILYHDVGLSQTIVKEVVKIAGNIPVSVKVGLFDHQVTMRNFLVAIACAGARGIVGINSLPATIRCANGKPYFGEQRKVSGVSGAAIFKHACNWVRLVAQINIHENLDLTIFGVGGITQPEQFDIFLNQGAHAALTATGALWDPYIADTYHQGKLHETTVSTNYARRASYPTL